MFCHDSLGVGLRIANASATRELPRISEGKDDEHSWSFCGCFARRNSSNSSDSLAAIDSRFYRWFLIDGNVLLSKLIKFICAPIVLLFISSPYYFTNDYLINA